MLNTNGCCEAPDIKRDMDHFYTHKDLGLCLTFDGLLWLGYSSNTLKSASLRKSASWPFEDNPEDKRKIILPYESCNPSRKADISQKLRERMGCPHPTGERCDCGDVYKYATLQPLQKLIIPDTKANAFYKAYRYTSTIGNPEALPANKIKHYTNEASILNLVQKACDDSVNFIKKELGYKSIGQFWDDLIEYINLEKTKNNVGGKFPTSYVRLISHKNAAIKQYKEKGYASLIHGLYGKQNAAKVNTEVAKAVLDELIDNPMQYDDYTVMLMYNAWALNNGYDEISDKTVGFHRRREDEQWIGRDGNEVHRAKHQKRIARYRPTAPLFLLENDDNHLDFLFTDPNDTSQRKHYHRMKAMIVRDSFNNLPLGKMYAENLSTELIRAAYVDAMYYIRSLTGGWYLPFETRSDRWGLKELQPFYKKMGHYHPTPVGSKGRGYIEQSFGDAHWKRSMKLASNGNYTGNNITATHRGVNIEFIKGNKKNYPELAESVYQIEYFFYLLRHMKKPNGLTPEQEWLMAWEQLPEEQKRPINDEQFLEICGIEHRPSGRMNSIDNYGVSFTLDGVHRKFTLPEDIRFRNVGKSVIVKYDPLDFSRILITDNERLSCVAHSTQLMPSTYKDYRNGDRRYLNALLEEQKNNVDKVTSKQAQRRKVLEEYGATDVETTFQIGLLDKDLKLWSETPGQLGYGDDEEMSRQAHHDGGGMLVGLGQM